ncbi:MULTISPECIES: hypothetical protein [unclassified Actinoplanes]|uniref:hypothetical protein n=1 Tax=unclassified Actinoplanes TaxID=2626549 RepID=UPI00156078B3|nr:MULTISPECIES: hypothetical protein [unclassified Actinoplanes]
MSAACHDAGEPGGVVTAEPRIALAGSPTPRGGGQPGASCNPPHHRDHRDGCEDKDQNRFDIHRLILAERPASAGGIDAQERRAETGGEISGRHPNLCAMVAMLQF